MKQFQSLVLPFITTAIFWGCADEEKIPMSEMLQHLLMCYKYGLKQLYYFQTFDGQGEIDVDKLATKNESSDKADDAECDSCVL